MRKRRLLEFDSKTKLLIIIAASIAIFAAIYLVLNHIEQTTNPVSTVTGSGFTKKSPDITYNGVRYVYKARLKNILMIGVDTTGEVKSTEGQYFTGGQSDVVMVLSIDYNNKKINVLQLDRDTMVELDVLDSNGNLSGTSVRQLALAYAYGDGNAASCELVENAVSRLLYGIPMDEYFSMNMSAVPIINDSVGGVPVTIEDDFSGIDSELTQGSTITLMGEQAVEFVHSRWNISDETNVSRMKRQQAYLSSFKSLFVQKVNENPSFVFQLDEDVDPYRVTSLNSETFTKLISDIVDFEIADPVVPESTSNYDGEFAETYVDDDALKQLIIDIFYEPAE